ncbi:MAG: MFS transporter [Candidatus Dadabacteria bacterium]|nr:MFS transporter [Candidatus Dadabacteria bacterium]
MNFTLVTLSNFFFFCNFSSFFLLPVHIRNLGGSESEIGWIMGAFGVTSLLCIPPVSALSDRRGRRPLMAAGALLMAGASALFLFIDGLGWEIFALRLIQGAGFAAFFTSASAAAADMAEPGRVAERLSVFGAFTILSYAAGPAAGEWVMNTAGAEGLIIYASSFGFAAFALCLFVKDENFSPGEPSPRERGRMFTALFTKDRAAILFANLTLAVGLGAMLNFFAVFADESGFAASRFFLTYAATVIAVRILSAKIADGAGGKRVASFALLAVAAALFLVSQTRSDTQAVLFCFLFSAAYGLLYPALGAMMADRAQTGMANAMGAFNMSFSLGINYAAFPLGMVADAFGLRTMFVAAAGVVLCGFLLFSAPRSETAGRER